MTPIRKKRIIVEVPDELHKEIKMRACKVHCSIKQYVIKALVNQIKKEEQYE